MSINQLLACCNCSPPDIPCKSCSSARCSCNPQSDLPDVIPVTAINIEVADLSVGVGTSRGRTDVDYAHFHSKRLHTTEDSTRSLNRVVLWAWEFFGNGFRYGDPLRAATFRGKMTDCSVGSKVGVEPKSYDPSDVPCPVAADSGNPNPNLPFGRCPVPTIVFDSQGEPIPNRCAETYCEYFEDLLVQGGLPGRTWNWHPDSCSNQTLGGTNMELEFDWPCLETQEAFDRAQAKYDFGQQRLAEAEAFCQNNPNDPDCGDGLSSCPALCHPAARDEIGSQPPSLLPCIKHCPTQPVCDYSKEVKYPDGTVEPNGDFVDQDIPCLTTDDGDGCKFTTQPVEQNFAAKQNCDHQCGPRCPGQRCCLISCFEEGCCDQLLYNPLTGESVQYNENGCIVDDSGNFVGGWKTTPNENGEYERCSKPLSDCTDEFGNTIVEGCRRDLIADDNRICTGVDDCCPAGEGFIGGDVQNWIFPRKMHPALSIERFGTAEPPQGIYAKHCPDTVDPFTPRASSFGDDKCSNLNAPTVGECKGGPSLNLNSPCDPADEHCPYLDEHNPRGMICINGICYPASSWDGGIPLHECSDSWPITHIPAACGNNACEDTVITDQGFEQGCTRVNCWNTCGDGTDCAFGGENCFPPCPEWNQAVYVSGTNEYEMGLQQIEVACIPLYTEEEFDVWDGVTVPPPDCVAGLERQLYLGNRAFQITLQYEGGGDGVSVNPLGTFRTGRGTFRLAQDIDTQENSCIFGEYNRIVNDAAGIGGYIVDTASFIPEYADDTSDWAALPESCYYDFVYDGDKPDCQNLQSRRVNPTVRVPTSNPVVIVS